MTHENLRSYLARRRAARRRLFVIVVFVIYLVGY
jgi:hypothetical protein